jgi:hypothetical protein
VPSSELIFSNAADAGRKCRENRFSSFGQQRKEVLCDQCGADSVDPESCFQRRCAQLPPGLFRLQAGLVMLYAGSYDDNMPMIGNMTKLSHSAFDCILVFEIDMEPNTIAVSRGQ